MDRRWWDSTIVRPCRSAWTPLDGRNHRRRNAHVQATHRSLQGGWEASRPLTRSIESRHTFTGLCRRDDKEAADDFFPGYAHTMTEIGKERGWPAVTRRDFDAQRGPQGALLIGDPDEVVDKIVRHSKTLGGISRVTFMITPLLYSCEAHASYRINRYSRCACASDN